MTNKFEYRKEGKKHIVGVRYENERGEEIYQVFEGSTKAAAEKKAKAVVK